MEMQQDVCWRALAGGALAVSLLLGSTEALAQDDTVDAAAVTANPELYLGKPGKFVGIIENTEKDGLNDKTLIVVLAGGLRLRLSKADLAGSGDSYRLKVQQELGRTCKITLQKKTVIQRGLKLSYRYEDLRPVLAKGTEVICQGTVKKERNYLVVDGVLTSRWRSKISGDSLQ